MLCRVVFVLCRVVLVLCWVVSCFTRVVSCWLVFLNVSFSRLDRFEMLVIYLKLVLSSVRSEKI